MQVFADNKWQLANEYLDTDGMPAVVNVVEIGRFEEYDYYLTKNKQVPIRIAIDDQTAHFLEESF